MQALALVVATLMAFTSALPTEELAGSPSITFCTDMDLGGTCYPNSLTVNCITVPVDQRDTFSSVTITPKLWCQVFSENGCTGDNRAIEGGKTVNLGDVGFDNAINSYRCPNR